MLDSPTRSGSVAMLIEIADLPGLMHTADEAMQNLQAAREQWLTLQAKLFAVPPDPVDVAACEAQAEVVKQAKADYDFHAGYVLASLRSALIKADVRAKAEAERSEQRRLNLSTRPLI
jgi:hypothetical protein